MKGSHAGYLDVRRPRADDRLGWGVDERVVSTGQRRAGVLLGGIYLLAAAVETTRALVTGDGGLVFWFGTLTTAGLLTLLGAVREDLPDPWRRVSILTGACLGMPATAWTLVVPALAAAVIYVELRR